MSNDETISLFNMPVGTKGIVVQIEGGHGMLHRLDAMGIKVGSRIQKITGQLMWGPVTLRVGSTHVAIGFGMARRIWVRVE